MTTSEKELKLDPELRFMKVEKEIQETLNN